MKAYRDTWGKGLDTYVRWFADTAVLLRDLMSDEGSLYVHIGWQVSGAVRIVLDEVFGIGGDPGKPGFRNEIAWKATSAHSDSGRYGVNHQSILFYTKGPKATWNDPVGEYDPQYVEAYYRYTDADGRRFKSGDLSAYGLSGGGYTYEWNGKTRLWRCPKETMQRLHDEGRIFYTKNGIARLKGFLDEAVGSPVQTIWADKAVQYVVSWGDENTGYDTQKSEGLLKRIISASSNPGDLVFDCFAGSGTTAAAAEALGRRWLTADLGRFAIHTTRKRLLAIPDVKPFEVQNLGKYERQAWQVAEFGERDDVEARQLAYRGFILQLYKADPVEASQWIHGRKAGRWVHVGAVDSPISTQDVTTIANSLKQLDESGNRVDVLGWDFAFDINETTKQQAARAGLDFSFKDIPREVLEPRAVEQGDIQFFELGALGIDSTVESRRLTVTLTDLIVRQDDIPADARASITHWSQMLDYWAIDWDFRDDTFHNQWQSYRTRKDPKLDLKASHTYEEPGDYRVMVKAIDILGNDTTKVFEVTVP